jgi:hypothetical protein
MTISELLTAIRKPYAEALAKTSATAAIHLEPAYRQADGSLSVEGSLGLPCRADIILKEGDSAGQSIQVDSESQLKFEPISFELGTTSVVLSPFVWDWVPFEVCGLGQEATLSVLRSWFLEWFDTEDQNDPTEEGLYGVVHFMSEPESTVEGWRVTIDLGSSPERALEALFFRLSDVGASQIRVG